MGSEMCIRDRNMQASWNDDATRHDKKTFNEKIGSLKIAQTIAKNALGLPDDTILEEIEQDGVKLLTEASDVYSTAPVTGILLKIKT